MDLNDHTFLEKFDFSSNDIKTHAYNIKKISKWYFTDHDLSINTCLNILAIAHGFKTYKALTTALQHPEQLEDLQENQTYFIRMMGSDLCSLFNMSEIGIGLIYSQIDHFLDMVASYIVQVPMCLRYLDRPSPLKGISLYSNLTNLKYFQFSEREFLPVALLNTIFMHSSRLQFPCEVFIDKAMYRYLKKARYTGKHEHHFGQKVEFSLDEILDISEYRNDQLRILFEIGLVCEMNALFFPDKTFIGKYLDRDEFEISGPFKAKEIQKLKISDLVDTSVKHDLKYGANIEGQVCVDYGQFYIDHVLSKGLNHLNEIKLTLNLTDAQGRITSEYIIQDTLSYERIQYQEDCELHLSFDFDDEYNNLPTTVRVTAKIPVNVNYSTECTYDLARFRIEEINLSGQNIKFSTLFYLEDQRERYSGDIEHQSSRELMSVLKPLIKLVTDHFNQKINKEKYEIAVFHLESFDIWEMELI